MWAPTQTFISSPLLKGFESSAQLPQQSGRITGEKRTALFLREQLRLAEIKTSTAGIA